MNTRKGCRRVRPERSDFLLEQFAARVIFVTQVHVDVLDAHDPCGDEHALEEPVRIALEVVAILERARFALVMFTAMRRGPFSARTIFHLRPTGKPAPPRPRKPESSIVLMTASTWYLPERHSVHAL